LQTNVAAILGSLIAAADSLVIDMANNRSSSSKRACSSSSSSKLANTAAKAPSSSEQLPLRFLGLSEAVSTAEPYRPAGQGAAPRDTHADLVFAACCKQLSIPVQKIA
jgi:hypothetical protein